MNTALRVLVYWEAGEWIAHLLELDLVGTGDSPEAANEQLVEAFEAQVTFCLQNKLNFFRPAPAEYFARWEATQKQFLITSGKPARTGTPRGNQPRAGYIPFSESDRRKYMEQNGFAPA